jgi:hypothetical protein
MYQNLQTVRTTVQKQIGMMRSCRAEHAHHAAQCSIHTRTHIQRFHRNPGCVDPDHRVNSRSSAAHSDAADTGHCTMTTPELLCSSIRIAGSAGEVLKGTGTKLLPLSTGALWGLTGADPVCSASTTHRRRRLA